ncbi:MAG TPA: hypothetical protein VHN11_02415, partial [Xanthobacteraceae bacterium]|nr:hypothetical protein [Xanthobacteraceae bacterium]
AFTTALPDFSINCVNSATRAVEVAYVILRSAQFIVSSCSGTMKKFSAVGELAAQLATVNPMTKLPTKLTQDRRTSMNSANPIDHLLLHGFTPNSC